jgi:hypothetical protein
MRSVRRDGTVRYDLTKKATIMADNGSVGGIVGVIIDISEQKRMEEDILKAKNLQSLGTLAGVASPMISKSSHGHRGQPVSCKDAHTRQRTVDGLP